MYKGRFAPSPSGPLHQGSLVCALASYLDARANNGEWNVRIENIDPPREQKESDQKILQCLQAHGLQWDTLFYQLDNATYFDQALEKLLSEKRAYRCNCTRKRLKELHHVYDGHCIFQPPREQEKSSIRLNIQACRQAMTKQYEHQCGINVSDTVQVDYHEDFSTYGDFVIHRKDGLYAYHLASVLDDIHQQTTHIVRGADLYSSCAPQSLLFLTFKATIPVYTHIPVVTSGKGKKLSKQNHAAEVDNSKANKNLRSALQFLNQPEPPPQLNRPTELLEWATAHWTLQNIPKCPSRPESTTLK